VPIYEIAPSTPFQASLHQLTRQYPHAADDVQACLESLRIFPDQGSPIPGWRRHVWKLRINSTDIRRGKRYGFRLIYLLEGRVIYPLFVYAKTKKEDVSHEEILRMLRQIGKGP